MPGKEMILEMRTNLKELSLPDPHPSCHSFQTHLSTAASLCGPLVKTLLFYLFKLKPPYPSWEPSAARSCTELHGAAGLSLVLTLARPLSYSTFYPHDHLWDYGHQ